MNPQPFLPAEFDIRDAADGDLPAITALYNDAALNTTATWDEHAGTVEGRRMWLRQRRELGLPVIVATDGAGTLLGYSSLSPFRPHSGYRLTAEHGIYLVADARGRGLGKALMTETLARAQACGLHCIVACMDSASERSIRLHGSMGFRECGRIRECGRKFGAWRELVLMQRLLDTPAT